LLEFAIVLAVFAMVLGTFLVPLTKQIEQQRYTETQRILGFARDALLSFAATNGRLPCPYVEAPGEDKGVEKFVLSPPAPVAGTPSNGLCRNFYAGGYLPAATLGLTQVDDQGYAVDAWGLKDNRIRYAVADLNLAPGFSVFTMEDGVKNAPIADPIKKISNKTYNFLFVCSDLPNPAGGATCGSTDKLADGTAIAVVYSLGANAADPLNATEALNASTTKVNPVFVSHGLRTISGNAFDDIVTWIGPNLLLGRMIAAGRLP
jgi:type II secretory pathway pseudopilin PulG